MSEENGKAKYVPAVIVLWDPDTQTVAVQRNEDVCKSWEFALGLLAMGNEAVRDLQRKILAGALQRQAAEQAHNARLEKMIKKELVH